MTAEKAVAILKNFTHSTQWSEIASADLIIEAVFEDMAVKHVVFQEIEEHANANALLASNTS
jgi:3-hydroxyacyl-CoA dehydrogenase